MAQKGRSPFIDFLIDIEPLLDVISSHLSCVDILKHDFNQGLDSVFLSPLCLLLSVQND